MRVSPVPAEWAGAELPAEGDSPPAIRERVFRVRTVLSCLVPVIVLALAARRVLGVDPGQVLSRLDHANAALLAVALGVFYLTVAVRALRWRVLLANVGGQGCEAHLPSTLRLARMVLVGSFANSITVGQLGDAYRAYLLKRAIGVSFATTLGTILVERLLDIVVLTAVLAGSALAVFGRSLPGAASDTLVAGLGLASLGVAGVFALPRLRPLAERLLPARMRAHYDAMARGVAGSFRQVPLLVACTAIGWLVEGATLYLGASAVGASLSPMAALLVAVLASLLGVVSITPGGVGVTEAGIVLVLRALGVDPAAAGAVALFNRIVNYWSITAVGLIAYAAAPPLP
jgi:uncharacterized membrane protein YbhN (UPF0104 family)